MGKQCVMCDDKMGIFSKGNTCKTCIPFFAEWNNVRENIMTLRSMSDEQLSELHRFGKIPLRKLWYKLYDFLESDNEITGSEIDILDKMKDKFNLTDEDVHYIDKILPYVYADYLKTTGTLPVHNPSDIMDVPFLLKKNELLHLACPATLKEIRVVNLGYEGGSQGFSFRIAKGVSYRVGSFRGHAIKEDRWMPISSGHLAITNQRIMLIPSAGGKQVDIPIDKINFYRCYSNGLQMYKSGREKGYFFEMQYGLIETAGIILGELTNQGR